MGLFTARQTDVGAIGVKDFEYLDPTALYLDSACQTLRPIQVIQAGSSYYREFNACGGRVKYKWGEKVDAKIDSARSKILKLLGCSEKDYVAAFTLNTTYGINLVLGQLPAGYKTVVTSEIEHNSVFLPTIALAKRLGIERKVLARKDNGELIFSPADLHGAVVVLNAVSNVDGRKLQNLDEIISETHKGGGIVVLDAAQAIAHGLDLVRGKDFDVLCGSAHKMYGPSLGFVVIKKALLAKLDESIVGGGTVEDIQKDSFTILSGDKIVDRLEPGLQNFAGIVAFDTALDWYEKNSGRNEKQLGELLFSKLKEIPSLHIINAAPSPIISLYSDKIDAHRLALYLSEQNIMARSGYFCCHYCLKNLKQLPPLLRFSLGAYNTHEQVEKAAEVLKQIIKNI